MLPRFREYHRPTSVEEALVLLQRPSVRTVPLAGGTTLLGDPDPEVEAVVDLQSLPLAEVQQEAQWVRVGAMVRVQTLVEHPLTQQLAGGLLARAARESAPLLTRNMATLGGCVASGDQVDPLLLALLALKAVVVLAGPGEYEQPLDPFLDKRKELLGKGGLITGVLVPQPEDRTGTALLKVSRTPADRPILNAAACLTLDDEGVCRAATVVLGGVAARPLRLRLVESALVGAASEADAMEAATTRGALPEDAPGDARASGAYRLEVAPVLLQRTLAAAWRRALDRPAVA